MYACLNLIANKQAKCEVKSRKPKTQESNSTVGRRISLD